MGRRGRKVSKWKMFKVKWDKKFKKWRGKKMARWTTNSLVTSINRELLLQEILALGLGANVVGVGLEGYNQVDRRKWDRATEPKVIGTENGVPILAQPGDIVIESESELRVGEHSQINAVITNHDYLGRSQEQQDEDQDAADIAQLRSAIAAPGDLSSAEIKSVARLLLRQL